MKATPARALLDGAISEREFMANVIRLARLRGWLVYHTLRSTGSAPGFPDLVMVRGDRVVWAELKAATGRLSTAQREWIARLNAAGQVAVVWRPNDWKTIEATLK